MATTVTKLFKPARCTYPIYIDKSNSFFNNLFILFIQTSPHLLSIRPAVKALGLG